MTRVTVLGLLAAFCTTTAYLPQVIKTWRTRSTTDISLGMFLLMVSGLVLWLAYGIILADLPLIAGRKPVKFFPRRPLACRGPKV